MEIPRVVLPLTIWIIHRLIEYLRPSQSRSLAVRRCILHTNLHRNRAVRLHIAFRNCETTLTRSHLDAMIRNAQSHRKPKCFSKPLRREARVGIAENGNHSAWRDRTVSSQGHLLGINKFREAFSHRSLYSQAGDYKTWPKL